MLKKQVEFQNLSAGREPQSSSRFGQLHSNHNLGFGSPISLVRRVWSALYHTDTSVHLYRQQ